MINYSSHPSLTNITFSRNSASLNGGGMENYDSSPVLTNVTFNENVAAIGSGMTNYFSNPQINNTIFWGNTSSDGRSQVYNDNSSPTLSDTVIQDGCPADSICTNIITSDPLLGALGSYGGYTQTIPLLDGSSAIDTGNDETCAATDQRGVTRPQGAHCDIGSYEYDLPIAPVTATPTVTETSTPAPTETPTATVSATPTQTATPQPRPTFDG